MEEASGPLEVELVGLEMRYVGLKHLSHTIAVGNILHIVRFKVDNEFKYCYSLYLVEDGHTTRNVGQLPDDYVYAEEDLHERVVQVVSLSPEPLYRPALYIPGGNHCGTGRARVIGRRSWD